MLAPSQTHTGDPRQSDRRAEQIGAHKARTPGQPAVGNA